jgi:hypothetical protein
MERIILVLTVLILIIVIATIIHPILGALFLVILGYSIFDIVMTKIIWGKYFYPPFKQTSEGSKRFEKRKGKFLIFIVSFFLISLTILFIKKGIGQTILDFILIIIISIVFTVIMYLIYIFSGKPT